MRHFLSRERKIQGLMGFAITVFANFDTVYIAGSLRKFDRLLANMKQKNGWIHEFDYWLALSKKKWMDSRIHAP